MVTGYIPPYIFASTKSYNHRCKFAQVLFRRFLKFRSSPPRALRKQAFSWHSFVIQTNKTQLRYDGSNYPLPWDIDFLIEFSTIINITSHHVHPHDGFLPSVSQYVGLSTEASATRKKYGDERCTKWDECFHILGAETSRLFGLDLA